jgi:DNA (cytosine-5)-methyltransferase 1
MAILTLDLFSGIGGFTLGLSATGGFRTVAFVEIDPFCQKVLAKHWPKIPLYKDIRQVGLQYGGIDLICGGFPCQDVSLAAQGNQQSILGDRSGLWWEYLRLISEGLPRWVIIENVENLLRKGLNIILSQLAALGYDAEWRVLGACHAGLPHIRKRLWVVAYRHGDGVQGRSPFPLPRLTELSRGANFRSFAEFRRESNYFGTGLCRTLHGIPNGVDRLRAVGNSIVPGIAYRIGQAILEAEAALAAPTV